MLIDCCDTAIPRHSEFLLPSGEKVRMRGICWATLTLSLSLKGEGTHAEAVRLLRFARNIRFLIGHGHESVGAPPSPCTKYGEDPA